MMSRFGRRWGRGERKAVPQGEFACPVVGRGGSWGGKDLVQYQSIIF